MGVLCPPGFSSYIMLCVLRPTASESNTFLKASVAAAFSCFNRYTNCLPADGIAAWLKGEGLKNTQELRKTRPPCGQAGIENKNIIDASPRYKNRPKHTRKVEPEIGSTCIGHYPLTACLRQAAWVSQVKHKTWSNQTPYIYLYLLKFFFFLFMLQKQTKKNK
jgi:hypothetical protein